MGVVHLRGSGVVSQFPRGGYDVDAARDHGGRRRVTEGVGMDVREIVRNYETIEAIRPKQ